MRGCRVISVPPLVVSWQCHVIKLLLRLQISSREKAMDELKLDRVSVANALIPLNGNTVIV